MKCFVIGATGYIGGSVASRLMEAGHAIVGLTRSAEGAEALRSVGIEPVVGSLTDLDLLAETAGRVDAVVNAANADDPYAVETILPILEGTGKAFVQTSGSSVIADRAGGEAGGLVFHEDTPSEPLPERRGRVAIDRLVLSYGQRGVKSVVIRPTLIYGVGLGLHKESIQVPRLMGLAKAKGVPLHIGRGLNVWSNVHIADVADLYRLALEKAPAGALFYAESGEASMRDVALAIGRRLGQGDHAEVWPMAEALKEWGAPAYATFASNSRVSAAKARAMLGWQPGGPSLEEEIARM